MVVHAGIRLNMLVSVHRCWCWVVLGQCRKVFLQIWGMQGRACRKESGGGGWGQARESLMVGVVSREW